MGLKSRQPRMPLMKKSVLDCALEEGVCGCQGQYVSRNLLIEQLFNEGLGAPPKRLAFQVELPKSLYTRPNPCIPNKTVLSCLAECGTICSTQIPTTPSCLADVRLFVRPKSQQPPRTKSIPTSPGLAGQTRLA